MRDKEAIDVERKNLSRNVERQAKVLERLHESERNLQNQIVSPQDFSELQFLEVNPRLIWKKRLSLSNEDMTC